MSRLDSFIRRLEAQRACLEMAAGLIADLDGEVLELGLGNGRTYDHLRKLLPHRNIYVCERTVAAHPDCVPPSRFLLLGDMRETLPAARARLAERVVLAHLDPGTGEAVASKAHDLAHRSEPFLDAGHAIVPRAHHGDGEQRDAGDDDREQARHRPVGNVRGRNDIPDQPDHRDEVEDAVSEHRAEQAGPHSFLGCHAAGQDGDAGELADATRQHGVREQSDRKR